MGDRAVHDLLPLGQQQLHMLCIAGPLSASGLLGEAPGEPNIPQPNMGVPTAGDLTLAFLGDAGVAGRVDMMREEVLRLGQLVLVAGAVRRATKGRPKGDIGCFVGDGRRHAAAIEDVAA